MGVNGSNAKPPSKFQIEIMATKVREYLNLQKDRKSNDAIKEEKALIKLLNSPGRSKLEEYLSMERIVGLLKIITADRILMSYADIVKQNASSISNPKSNVQRVNELMPYILSIIYAARPLGLNCMNDFKNMMTTVFSKEMIEISLQESKMVPPELFSCFTPITPSFQEINQYAIQMCQRNEFSLETLNMVGHNFSPYAGRLQVQPGVIPQQPPKQGPPNGMGGNGSYGGDNNNHGGNNNNQGGGNNFGNGGNNNYGGNPYTPQGHNPNQNPNQAPYGVPAEYTTNNNDGFNPNNFMPIYQPTNFDIPKTPYAKNNDFADYYVPKNAQSPPFVPDPSGNFNYPSGSNLYDDLDKKLEDRFKKL